MTVKLATSVVLKVMEDESVIIISAGQIFHIDGIAAKVIKRLKTKSNIEAICQELGRELGIAPTRILGDAKRFVQQLVAFKLAVQK